MIRKRIGSLVVRAYPRETRRTRGAEMVDTLLDTSEHSGRAFIAGCASLVSAGLNERGHHGARLALAGVVVAVAGAGGAIALTLGGGPAAGGGASRAQIAWVRASRQALVSVSEHGGACGLSANRSVGSEQILSGAPSTRLSSLLTVMRQPAPVADRVSETRVRELHIDAQGIYIRYAREGVTDGVIYYMIPAASVGGVPLSDRCYADQLTAFERETARFPAAERSRATSWERQLIKHQRGPNPGIAVVTAGGGSTGAEYVTADELRTNPWRSGGGGSHNITKTTLVLPDSVASVTAHYAAQTYPGRVPKAVTVTRKVTDNLVVLVFKGAWDPPALTYSSATGTVLWSTPTRSS